MRTKIIHFLPVIGLALLSLILFPVTTWAAAFQVKKGYSDQALSEYETCLTVTAEDFASGKIMTNSDRVPVFLGDRWQLCWIHGCHIQNLIEACGFDDIMAIETINLENRMTFTGEEILDESPRLYYLKASSAMYYDDGSLKMQDYGYDVSFWTPEDLALFYEIEEIPIGSDMDNYYDSSIIARRWGEFAHKASSAALVETCLDQGLTLFYGQLDPFDVNQPIEGIHTIYVTLRGSKPSSGEGSGDNVGKTNTSTGNKQNNTQTNNTKTNNTGSTKKTTKKKTTKKTSAKKKTTNKSTTKKTTAGTRESTYSSGNYRQPQSGGYAPVAAYPSSYATTSTEKTNTTQTNTGAGSKPTEKMKEADLSGQTTDTETIGAMVENDTEEQTPKKYTFKSSSKTEELKTAITEMEPDPKAVPMLSLCILAGAVLCMLRFRMQIKGGKE